MAEVIICAQNRGVVDHPGKWYRGMAIAVKPDGWEWGKKEGPPWNFILELPGLTVEEAEELFLEEDYEEDTSLIGDALDVTFFQRRVHRVPELDMEVMENDPRGRMRDTGRKAQIEARRREEMPRDEEKRPPIRDKMDWPTGMEPGERKPLRPKRPNRAKVPRGSRN